MPVPKQKRAKPTGAMKLMRTRRQQAKSSNYVDSVTVNVETYQCKKPAERSRDWIPELGLSQSDRDTLLNPVGWVTDSVVDASQKLLKCTSPVPGLEPVACGLTMSYTVQPGEFVQILNTGNVTASAIGVPHPVIRVYDSKYSSAGTSLEAQISSMICTQEENVTLEFMDVPIQAGILYIHVL